MVFDLRESAARQRLLHPLILLRHFTDKETRHAAGKRQRHQAAGSGRSRSGKRGGLPLRLGTRGRPHRGLVTGWHTYLLLSGRTRTQTATAPSSAILSSQIPGNRPRTSAAGVPQPTGHPAFKFKFSQMPLLIEPRPGDVTGRSICVAARGAQGGGASMDLGWRGV